MIKFKKQVEEFNKEYKEGKIDMSFKVDFNEKLTATGNIASKSSSLNVDYFILQKIYQDLKLNDFSRGVQDSSKISIGKGGEKASDYYSINQSVIDKEEKYDGYYAVATNLEDDAKAIL